MPSKLINGHVKVDKIGMQIYFDLPNGKILVNLFNTVWKNAGQSLVSGGKIIITSPSGRIISNGTTNVFLPPNMNQTVQFNLPTIGGVYEWGVYHFRLLVDDDPNLTLDFSFDLCAPFSNEKSEGEICMQVVSDCEGGLVKVYLGTVGYKGVTPDTMQHFYKFYYPTGSNQPAVNISAFPVQLSLITGDNKIDGYSIGTYSVGDDVMVYVKYLGTEEKFISCTFPCHLWCAYRDLVEKVEGFELNSKEYMQEYQKLISVNHYMNLIQFGYHCGTDVSNYIETAGNLLGVGGGDCPNVNSGSTTTTTTAFTTTTTTTTNGSTTSTTTLIPTTTTTTTAGTTTSTTTGACPTVTDIVMDFIDPSATTTTTTVPIGTPLADPELGRDGIGSTSVTIKWKRIPNAETYRLERATNSSFTTGLTVLYDGPESGLIPELTNSDDCKFFDDAAHGLVPSGNYYYRARAHDINGLFADSGWGTKQYTLPAATKLVTINGGGGGIYGSGIEGDPQYFSFWNGSQVLPVNAGDEVALGNPSIGQLSYFTLGHFHGTPTQPVLIRNDGQVTMTSGFDMDTCTYLTISGKHASKTQTRGFNVQGSGNGATVTLKGLCQHIKVEGLRTGGSAYGAWIKNEADAFRTDPDCGAWIHWPHRMTYIEVCDCDMIGHTQDTMYSGSSDPWGLNRPYDCHGVQVYRRPTGFAHMHFHDITITTAGRSGMQLGGWDAGINRINNCVISQTGNEFNDQQGAGIAIGGAVNSIEIDHNTISNTYRQGIYSYGFGQLYLHDNSFDQIGTIANDATRDLFINKLTLSGGQTLSNLWMDTPRINQNGGKIATDSLGEYFFQFYANEGGNPLIRTQKRVTSPSRTPAAALASMATIAPGSHAGDNVDPYVGLGASSAVIASQVSTPANATLPYGQSALMINTFSNDSILVYGDPAGRTTFRIESNSFGTQTGLDDKAIVLLQGVPTYGTANTICYNTYLGGALTNANVYAVGTSATWSTDCSTSTTTTVGSTTTTTTAGTSTTTTTSGTTTTTTAGTTTTTTTGSSTMVGRMRVDQFRIQVWEEYTYGLTWLPQDYGNAGNTTKYPLLIFLHGGGAVGDGIPGLSNLYIEGFPKILNDNPTWNVEIFNPDDEQTYKFIVICPQAPYASHWSYGYGAVINILDDVMHRYRIDPDRVYISGLSAGGTGSIGSVSNSQSFTAKIAAIAPVAAAGFNTGTEDTNWPLSGGSWGVKLWTIVGNDDAWKVFNTSLVDRYNGATPSPSTAGVLTVLPSPAGHNPATFNTSYDFHWNTNVFGLNLYQWFLKYKRNISGSTTTTTTAGTTTTTTTASTTTTTTSGTTTTTTTGSGTTTTTTAGTTTTTTTAAGIPTAKFNLSATTQNVSGWNNIPSGGNTTAIGNLSATDGVTGWQLVTNSSEWNTYIGFSSSNGDGGSSAGSPSYTPEFPAASIQGTFIQAAKMFVPGQSVYPFQFNNLPAGTYELLIQGSIKASVVSAMANGIFYAKFGIGSEQTQTVLEQANASNQFVTLSGTITAGQTIKFGLFTETNNAGNANVVNAIILRKTS